MYELVFDMRDFKSTPNIHPKYFVYTVKDVCLIQGWNFKSSYIWVLLSISWYILRLKWEFFLALIIWSGLQNPVQTYQIPEALVDISEEDATSCMLMIFTFLWQLMSMSSAHGSSMILNTPRPKHNDRQLADYISNLIFLSDNCFILFHFSLSFVTNMPALVQIMGGYKTEFQREFSIFEIQDMIKI